MMQVLFKKNNKSSKQGDLVFFVTFCYNFPLYFRQTLPIYIFLYK